MPRVGNILGWAITGADGLELSDRWLEALAIRDRVSALWMAMQTP